MNHPPVPPAPPAPADQFRWGTVPLSARDWLRTQTENIVALAFRQAGDTVRIGQFLNEARARLKHGLYKAWVRAELPFSESTARRYREVARAFAAFQNLQFELFDESALYVLSEFKTPPAARDHAVALANDGKRVTHALALEILDAHRDVKGDKRTDGRDDRKAFRAHQVEHEDRMRAIRAAEADLREKARQGTAGPQHAARWWALVARLATEATMVRIEKTEDTDHDDDVLYTVTAHFPDGEPRFACKRTLAQAVGAVLTDPNDPTRTCEDRKVCAKCGELKLASEFNNNDLEPDLLNRWCRADMNAKKRRDKAKKASAAAPPDGTRAA